MIEIQVLKKTKLCIQDSCEALLSVSYVVWLYCHICTFTCQKLYTINCIENFKNILVNFYFSKSSMNECLKKFQFYFRILFLKDGWMKMVVQEDTLVSVLCIDSRVLIGHFILIIEPLVTWWTLTLWLFVIVANMSDHSL